MVAPVVAAAAIKAASSLFKDAPAQSGIGQNNLLTFDNSDWSVSTGSAAAVAPWVNPSITAAIIAAGALAAWRIWKG